jgi:hypothetical protein
MPHAVVQLVEGSNPDKVFQIVSIYLVLPTRGIEVVEVLCYMQEGRGFEKR